MGAMPEPRIQYAKTSDGVNIAYAVAGSGPPLVHVRTFTGSHVELDWQVDFPGKLFQALAARRTLVIFDRRGCGLSDRDVGELTLEALTDDLEAVVDELGLSRFVLVGAQFGAMATILYALRHPDRVSALIGVGAVMNGQAFWNEPRNKALRAMREADFDTYVETVAHMSGVQEMAKNWPLMTSAEGQKAFVDASEHFDVTELAARLNVPTLLVYRTEMPSATFEATVSRDLATQIHGARLISVPWEPRAVYIERLVTAIDHFVGDLPAQAARPAGALVTILFTDLTSSTSLTQRLGDAKAQELVRAHNAIVREALASSGGTEIKHTGDGIMASFPSSSGALECAVAIQRGVVAHGGDDLAVHIGVNAGEPVAEESDLFGTSVQLARRICDHASSGQILVSNVVRELAAGKGFLFADIGEVVPKGFEEPVRLYEVRWRTDG
jgi:class 3 adenylate cyclase